MNMKTLGSQKERVEAEGGKMPADSRATLRARNFCEKGCKPERLRNSGQLDVLMNNAAFQVHTSKFEDLTAKHFDETLKTNTLHGYFYMAQMKPGSAIVNTGSVCGLLGSEGLLDYSADQRRHPRIHAIAVATHLVPRGIRDKRSGTRPLSRTPLNPSDKQAKDVSKFGADTPMRRPAQPEEIAPAYVFLASPHCSSYITGEILPIIGGYTGG